MVPDPKPPGRKRGRPPNASKPTASASQDRPDEYEADVEETAHPKQRGRLKKSADAVEQSPPQEEAPKKKRSRPSLDSKDGDATAEAQPKRKRGRSSLEKQQNEEVTEDAPKPKRGRRPKPTEEQQEEQPDENEAVEKAEKPKRRRRAKPAEEEHNEEQENEEEAVQNAGKKKRGKRAKPTEEEEQPAEDEAPKDTRKQKRKARSKATEDEQPEEPQQQPRKRGRKTTQQQEPEPEEAEPAPRKRRRREAPAEEEPEEEQTVRRSPRNSLRDIGPESVHNKGTEGVKSKKKGRVSNTREQEEAENQQDEAQQPKKRGRRKGSRPSAENTEAAAEEQEQQNTNKRRGRRTSKEAAAASSSDEQLPSPPKPYPHIAPHTRIIKSSTIAAKWTPLTGASLPAASSILTLAHQPILQRTSSTRNRRTHASAALHLVSRRIERKLARGMPFPPASSSGGVRMGRRRGADADGGRALELDFEAVLDGKTALERQLVPAKHAVELLRAEKARMEQELEDDYEKLRKLEANARAQTRERKDLYRKAHVLAPTSQPLSKDPDNTITTDDCDSSSSLKASFIPLLQIMKKK
ncbi:hypothetical protein N0V84_012016 [Fusarium piperis]|uniref:Uncharacterized protein n=1 Tax=Fusarium piperis TaxID=1435070 RepID=A0A9W8W2K3_9HYPO|nr:hypothetical protein N0V84_012016 [Fusarium piperis]